MPVTIGYFGHSAVRSNGYLKPSLPAAYIVIMLHPSWCENWTQHEVSQLWQSVWRPDQPVIQTPVSLHWVASRIGLESNRCPLNRNRVKSWGAKRFPLLSINTAKYFIALRSWFLGQIRDSYGCFLDVDSCQATSVSHAAKQQWFQQFHLLGWSGQGYLNISTLFYYSATKLYYTIYYMITIQHLF